MIENLSWSVSPPYGFYFRVSFFQMKTGKMFNTSFTQVDGLGWSYESKPFKDSQKFQIDLPTAVKCNHIILKSPLQPLPSLFETWVEQYGGKLPSQNGLNVSDTFDMVVTMQSQLQVPVSAWLCSRVYPVKVSFEGINSERSGLVIETVELACNRIERKL